jgi:hypothetical protein
VLGSKGESFGWTQVLMVCAGLAAADFAAGQRARFLSALPWLWPLFVVSYLVDRASGFSGVGTLDNTILAGPIFALLSVMVYERCRVSAFACAYLCVAMESTTGALTLVACYLPLAVARFRMWLVGGGALAALGIYVVAIDKVHVGYDTRLQVILQTLAASIAQPLGHGWGSYPLFAMRELPRTWAGEVMAHAHSDITQLFYEAGIGAVLVVSLYLIRNVVLAYRARSYAALGSMLGLAVFSAIGFPWHVAPSAAVGLLTMANFEGALEAKCTSPTRA